VVAAAAAAALAEAAPATSTSTSTITSSHSNIIAAHPSHPHPITTTATPGSNVMFRETRVTARKQDQGVSSGYVTSAVSALGMCGSKEHCVLLLSAR
jgi:hypothetical protein